MDFAQVGVLRRVHHWCSRWWRLWTTPRFQRSKTKTGMTCAVPQVNPKTTTGLGWWFLRFDKQDPPLAVMLRCSGGHDATLRHLQLNNSSGHTIAEDGTVTPSVVCPYDGCDFHKMVQLTDWIPPA